MSKASEMTDLEIATEIAKALGLKVFDGDKEDARKFGGIIRALFADPAPPKRDELNDAIIDLHRRSVEAAETQNRNYLAANERMEALVRTLLTPAIAKRDELAEVRADKTSVEENIKALSLCKCASGVFTRVRDAEIEKQERDFLTLLARERELLAARKETP